MIRHKHKQRFLETASWHNTHESLLAQDASFRTYYRLKDPSSENSVVLMDAPPSHETLHSFIHIANLLRKLALRVPQILHEDQELGFLILEDFGDQTFTNILQKGADPKKLYTLAIDALAHIHQNLCSQDLSNQSLDFYTVEKALLESKLFIDWYVPAVALYPLSQAALLEFESLFKTHFEKISSFPQGLTLRDFHADNLMIVPKNSKNPLSACGILDFQDAVIGPLIYDLVSLLEDVRHDIDPQLSQSLKTYYKNIFPTTPWKDDIQFENAYAFWALQRNLKILGIFTRLFLRDKKERYLSYIPRTLKLIEHELSHPSLKDLKQWFDHHLPLSIRTIPRNFIPKRAMILAAGKGERLRPLTENLPKPLLKIGEDTLLDYALERCAEQNIEHIIINTHYKADQIETHLSHKSDLPYTLELSYEPVLLETAGGVLKVLKNLGPDPFYYLVSDVIWENILESPFLKLARCFDPRIMDACLLLCPTQSTDTYKVTGYEGRGDFFMETISQNASPIFHRGDHSHAPYVFPGIKILSASLFEGFDPLNKEPLPFLTLYKKAQSRGRLFGVPCTEGSWFHVTTPESYKLAQYHFKDKSLKKF